MRNRNIIIAVVAVVVIIGIIFFTKSIRLMTKRMPKKAVAAGKIKKEAPHATSKKVISKGKGALTVAIKNSKNIEVPMRIRIFRSIDKNSSIYSFSNVGNRMQELLPGNYDIEVDTVPQKIYKDIKVNQGKETIAEFGSITGSLLIKTLNSKKGPAYYPLRVLYAKSDDMVTTYMTNKPIEILPGTYDVEIGVSPRQYNKNIKIAPGKETFVDMGCITGSLLIKTVDENNKNIRSSVKITKAGTNEMVGSGISNRPIELGGGVYNIEVMSYPKQSKKDVKVNAGEEAVIEFTVQPPPAKSAGPAARRSQGVRTTSKPNR